MLLYVIALVYFLGGLPYAAFIAYEARKDSWGSAYITTLTACSILIWPVLAVMIGAIIVFGRCRD